MWEPIKVFKDLSIISLKTLSIFFRVCILFIISEASSAEEFLFYSQSINFSNVAILIIGLDLIRHISKKIVSFTNAIDHLWSFHSRSIPFISIIIIFALSIFIKNLIFLILLFIFLEYAVQEICRINIILGKRFNEALLQFIKNFIPFLVCYFAKENIVFLFFVSSICASASIILLSFFIEKVNINEFKILENPFNQSILLFIFTSMTITVFFRLFFFADKLIIETYEDNFIVDYVLVASLSLFAPFLPDNIHNNKVLPAIIRGDSYSLFKFIFINNISAIFIALAITVFYFYDFFNIFRGSLSATYVFFITFIIGIISTLISYMSIVIRYDIFRYCSFIVVTSFLLFCALNFFFEILIAWAISGIVLYALFLIRFIYEKRLESN